MTDNYYDTIARGYDNLHKEEQLRKLNKIKEHIWPTGKLLDVGCGTGISTDFWTLAQRFGVDPSNELIKQNTNQLSTFQQTPAEKLPFADNTFDVVVSLTAIQNFTDLNQGLHEIKRVGNDTFVLTWLKRSEKNETIKQTVEQMFGKPTVDIQDQHDMIYVYM